MSKKILLETRPNYFQGQLLREDDFLEEQSYHLEARRRYNLGLHGCGVVHGLEVIADGHSLTIQPGLAIDRQGHDIFLRQSETLALSGFGPHQLVKVVLSHREEPPQGSEDTRLPCYAVLSLDAGDEERAAVVLAMVQLDDKGQAVPAAVDYRRTDYARAILRPGVITAAELAPGLRTGWLRLPFRPIPLANVPPDEKEIPQGFRVGATEARSPSPKEGEKDKGAAGTMAIPIPPSARYATRFRIAGETNQGELRMLLVAGGWDPDKTGHYRRTLVEDMLTKEPFFETYPIEETAIDPEYHTLSLWVRCTRKASISLIAVELAY
jgi:hypothetical protein